MQIDFHHGVTYVVARLAGFAHRQADVIAYSAQYVDDATNDGTIVFDNGAMYNRTSSAHRLLDYRHFDRLARHLVWIPYHFLPGNCGKRAGQHPDGTFNERIVCRADGPVAQEMVSACIRACGKRYALHRLGITMHTFADTWAHQGFAGLIHEINRVEDVRDERNEPDERFKERMEDFFENKFNRAVY
jgi:hypothetical protein